MTLKELAIRLKEIYNFDVLTCCDDDNCKLIELYKLNNKDSLLPEYKDYYGISRWRIDRKDISYIQLIKVRETTFNDPLDLSEYEFERYNPLRYDHTDYSKCIIVL